MAEMLGKDRARAVTADDHARLAEQAYRHAGHYRVLDARTQKETDLAVRMREAWMAQAQYHATMAVYRAMVESHA